MKSVTVILLCLCSFLCCCRSKPKDNAILSKSFLRILEEKVTPIKQYVPPDEYVLFISTSIYDKNSTMVSICPYKKVLLTVDDTNYYATTSVLDYAAFFFGDIDSNLITIISEKPSVPALFQDAVGISDEYDPLCNEFIIQQNE